MTDAPTSGGALDGWPEDADGVYSGPPPAPMTHST